MHLQSDHVGQREVSPACLSSRERFDMEGETMSVIRKQKQIRILLCAICIAAFTQISTAQEIPSDYQQVLKIVDKKGDYKANVLKVNIPRNDLQVKIAGHAVPTPFGFGGWFAMTKGDGGEEVLMGDLVLTEGEVSHVMSALLDHGIEVTALHNHFFWDDPRVFFMHIHGHGKAVDLANQLKPAIDLIGLAKEGESASVQKPASAKQGTTLDTDRIAKIVGHAGEQNGPVYKITLGRDDVNLKDMGATINARMGLNTWAAFVGTNDDAAVAGDIAMLENEVTPVLKSLRSSGLDVVAIQDRKSTRLNSSHLVISYAVFCLKKKKKDSCVSITTERTQN